MYTRAHVDKMTVTLRKINMLTEEQKIRES